MNVISNTKFSCQNISEMFKSQWWIFVIAMSCVVIGLFIIIYAVTEIVDYIYYNSKNKDEKTNVKKQKNKKLIKSKNQKVIEAVIEEE